MKSKIKRIALLILFSCVAIVSGAQEQVPTMKEIEEKMDGLFSTPLYKSMKGDFAQEELAFVKDTSDVAKNIMLSFYDLATALESDLNTNDIIVSGNHIWALYNEHQASFSEGSIIHFIAYLTKGLMGFISSTDNKDSFECFEKCEELVSGQPRAMIMNVNFSTLMATYCADKGEYERAISIYNRNREVLRKLHLEHSYSYALIDINQAEALNSMDNYEEAEGYFKNGISIMKGCGADNTCLYLMYMLELCETQIRLEHFDDANITYIEAFTLANDNDFFTIEVKRSFSLLEVLYNVFSYDLESLPKAMFTYLELCEEEVQQKFPLFTEKMRQQYWDAEMSSFYDGILPILAGINDEPVFNFMVYNALLFSRGILLNSNLTFEQLVKESNEVEMQEKYQKFLSLKSQINKLSTYGCTDEEMHLLKELRIKNEIIENELLQRVSKDGNLVRWAGVSTDSLRHCMRNEDLAIEIYSRLKENEDSGNEIVDTIYNALLLRKNEIAPRRIELGNQSIIHELRNNPETSGYKLWQKLLEDDKDAVNIYIAFDGELCNIPVEYCGWDSMKTHMPDNCRIYRVSSTREIVKRDLDIGEDVAVYGGIKYGDSDETPYLKKSKDEALSILKSVNNAKKNGLMAKMYSGEEATEESFKQLSGKRKRIIHIATHAGYGENTGEENAMQKSYLKFAGCDDQNIAENILSKEDGLLRASEIANLDFRELDLVVLSACNSGVGNIGGDGVYGLQRGFKKAGANTIMMSLWEVKDTATEYMMKNFYKELLKTGDKYGAFEQARIHTRKKFPDFKDWAAFVILDAVN